MNYPTPTISVSVDLMNPGQFFACCGLLELASQASERAEAWFADGQFLIASNLSLADLIDRLQHSVVNNTMAQAEHARLDELTMLTKKQRELISGADEEKKALESRRRELPIVLTGGISMLVDWFTDDLAGGSRFKTWAGQQSVLDIARAMHKDVASARIADESALWYSARDIGLPFYFDSDLGGLGSALDVGFSFNQLREAETTRIEETSRPALELLAFIGLQRFRPCEIARKNRFTYGVWRSPLPASIAAAACQAVAFAGRQVYEFRLLYRTKYLKSFLPASRFQGARDE
jgi:CRISPR-associated protein Csb3